MKRFRVEIGLAVILLLYVAQATLLGRFSGFDEPWYKSAGREWGLHGDFASPELTGFFPGIALGPEKVFFCYPPVYPFAFGLFVKVAGFGWRQCVLFDALIRAALSVATYLVARRLGGDRLPRWAAALTAVAVLPGNLVGRPDDLATLFGLLAMLVALGGESILVTGPLAGILLGLCAGTSVAAAVMLAIIALVIFATNAAPASRKLLGLAFCGASAATVLALVVAPILIPHPRAIDQYRSLANAYALQAGPLTLFSGFKFKRSLILGCLPLLAVGLWLSAKTLAAGGRERWLRLWLGPLLSLTFFFVTSPAKAMYLWFVTPWLLAATVAELSLGWGQLPAWRRAFAGGVTVAAVLAGGELAFKGLVSVATMPQSQTPEASETALAAIIPPGRSVLTLDSWWLLARDHPVFDARWACVDSSAVDYVVLTGNGSGGPGIPLAFDDSHCGKSFPLKDYEPIDDRLSRHVPTLFGRPLMNSAYGFGNLVLRRRVSAADPREDARSEGNSSASATMRAAGLR